MAPTALLIGGTHGAGKTTLGERLSRRLDWPLVSRDRVRGGLAWTAEEAEPEAGGPLSTHAVAVFFEITTSLVTAGVSLVVESAFRRGISEGDLGPLIAIADVRWVQCVLPRQLAIARCESRGGREFVATMLESRDESRWTRIEHPPDLAVPVLTVDTSDGYRPSLDAIVDYATRPLSKP